MKLFYFPAVVSLLAAMPLSGDIYLLIRWIIFGFGIWATILLYANSGNLWIFYAILAVIFNPIFPIYLYNKVMWVVLDVTAFLSFLYMAKNTMGGNDLETDPIANNYKSFHKAEENLAATSYKGPKQKASGSKNFYKIGEDIAGSVITLLETILREHYPEMPIKNIPLEAFEDDYIFGFIYSFGASVLVFGYETDKQITDIPNSDKGDYYAGFANTLDQRFGSNFFSKGRKSEIVKAMKSPQSRDGRDAGTLVAALIYNRLSPAFTSPQLEQARKIAMQGDQDISATMLMLTLLPAVAEYVDD